MKMEKIIDAEGRILGRLSTVVAKQLLMGENVVIINAGKAVISGSKRDILAHEISLRDRGSNIGKGPFYRRVAKDYVKRVVRGMLPKNDRGINALKNLRVYSGTPRGVVPNMVVEASVEKLPFSRFMTIESIVKSMGGKQ